MTDEQILEKIGLSEASEEMKKASLEAVKRIADKRTMGILESLMDEDQVAMLESRTAKGSSLEHNTDWMQKTLSLDVKEVYNASLDGYVNELAAKAGQL